MLKKSVDVFLQNLIVLTDYYFILVEAINKLYKKSLEGKLYAVT